MLSVGIEAVELDNSINVAQEQGLQCVHSSLSIRAGSSQRYRGTGNNAQGHDSQQALGIHLAAAGFQPNAALKFVGLLHEVCSLFVVQAGLAANQNFLIEHIYTLLFIVPGQTRRVCLYHSIFGENVN